MTLPRKRVETLFLLGLLITLFIACDNEFVDLDSDLINEEVATNFNIDSVRYDVVSYTVPVGPVQTNGMPMNLLGAFNDLNYGTSTQNFVSQLRLTNPDPEFGENISLDSVVLYIPYFSSVRSIAEDGTFENELDSIFGDDPIKLAIYESEYFLRSFDPNGDFDDEQVYFSNYSASLTEPIDEAILMGPEIMSEIEFTVNSASIPLTDSLGETTQVLPPGIRMKLDTTYWKRKIIDMEGSSELGNQNNFNDYFRGVYFKSEAINNSGTLMGLNLNSSNAAITLYFKRDFQLDGSDEVQEIQSNFELRFGDIVANFTDNDFQFQIPEGNEETGDPRLYLKGNQGSRATIRLFDGMDDQGNSNFENFKQFFGTYNNGEFESSRKLINEANLVFYVDQDLVQGEEPDRIYLYDVDNARPLSDYFVDAVIQNNPGISVSSHLGILEREGDDPNGEGIKYKMRITNHIRNLIELDSTNIDLGLAVSINVNLESVNNQGFEQTEDGSDKFIPLSSILSPRGTILHGNNSEDEDKRLYLEIFYTCLETDEDCDE